MIIEKLKQFRQQIYEDLGKARDALFELMDAVLLTPKVSSIAELSLCPVFRRRWSSVYEALEDSDPDPGKLSKHYIAQIPYQELIVLVGDHTGWPRPDAVTLRERTYGNRNTHSLESTSFLPGPGAGNRTDSGRAKEPDSLPRFKADVVMLGRSNFTPFRSALSSLSTTLCHRALVSFSQDSIALVFAQTGNPPSWRTLE